MESKLISENSFTNSLTLLVLVKLGKVSSSLETSLYSFVSTKSFDKRSFIEFSSSNDGFSSKSTY